MMIRRENGNEKCVCVCRVRKGKLNQSKTINERRKTAEMQRPSWKELSSIHALFHFIHTPPLALFVSSPVFRNIWWLGILHSGIKHFLVSHCLFHLQFFKLCGF